MKAAALIILSVNVLLTGCYTIAPVSPIVVDQQARIVKLSAVGYGAGSSFDSYSAGQKKLMAMRASKLDAYRALAEQIQGVRVTGNSTVSAMIAQNDSFRVYVDAYVRGARVVSINAIADGNYETTVEIDFDEQLVRNYAAGLRGYPAVGVRGTVGPGAEYGSYYGVAPVYAPVYGTRSAVAQGAMYGSTFYYSEN